MTRPFGPVDLLDFGSRHAGGTGRSTRIVDMPDDEWQYEIDLNL